MCVRRDFGKTNTRGGFGAGYIDKGTGGVTGIRENRKSYYRRKVLTRGGGETRQKEEGIGDEGWVNGEAYRP